MYTVNSYDICVQGFERLRSGTEFILPIHVGPSTTVADVRDEMKAEIQRYAQPDGFDYEACRTAIDAFCDDLRPDTFKDLEEPGEDGEGCILFVYMTGPGYADDSQ